jgi:CheY-like chemotaxis protein
VRVIAVDDSALIREGLASSDALVAVVDRTEPDVVIMDIRMPPDYTDEGIRAAHELRERTPAVGVLLLSQHLDTHSAWELFRDDRGGLGCLLKDRVLDIDDFVASVRRGCRRGHRARPASSQATCVAVAVYERSALHAHRSGTCRSSVYCRRGRSIGAWPPCWPTCVPP